MRIALVAPLLLATVATISSVANGFSIQHDFPSTSSCYRRKVASTSSCLASTPSKEGEQQQSSESSSSSARSNDAFIFRTFATDVDDNNSPPSLKTVLNNLRQLTHQGSDIRGRFVDHPRLGRISKVSKAIKDDETRNGGGIPALTPFASFCLGHAFGRMVLSESSSSTSSTTTIALGRDPRPHGIMLCDAFARGVQSADENKIRVVYTGIATTPSMFHFCRAGLCDGAVMVTASHLPSDRNGFKLFTSKSGGFTKHQIQQMNRLASDFAQKWHDKEGLLPPTSGGEGVFCSEWVDFMPHYASTLQNAVRSEVEEVADSAADDVNVNKPLEGLTIVLNSGNGAGGFFYKVLEELGADVSASIGIEPNGEFPSGIPNPEKKTMIDETIDICKQVKADLGILLDTDADRSGFVVPVVRRGDDNGGGEEEYEPLNRNRLIALLSVIFSRTSPGCAIVTDSVTSEGLADFLENQLGLQHVRYLKGYANVIGKAQELTNNGIANAEMAIETSGHCAMKENGYLDDGTYTAVKIIGLLAREKLAKHNKNGDDESPDLLNLISSMKEMPVEAEIRMNVMDGSLDTMATLFDSAAKEIEDMCSTTANLWTLDEENLEGIRVRTPNGGFFMLRKSLHDPLISLQVEAQSKEDAIDIVVEPLLKRLESVKEIESLLDTTNLKNY